MEKKYIVIILLIIILIFIGVGFYTYNNSTNNQNSTVKVGDLYFNMPNGYIQGTPNKLGDVTLSNGKNPIFITYYNDTNITKYINKFNDSVEKNGETIDIKNFTTNDLLVYKATINESGMVNYWFIKNDKIYSIYSWSKIDNVDIIFSELINSKKNN